MGKFARAAFITAAIGLATGGFLGGTYYAVHDEPDYYKDIYPSISTEDSARMTQHASIYGGIVGGAVGSLCAAFYFIGRARRQSCAQEQVPAKPPAMSPPENS